MVARLSMSTLQGLPAIVDSTTADAGQISKAICGMRNTE